MSRNVDEGDAEYIKSLRRQFQEAKSCSKRERILKKMEVYAPPNPASAYQFYINSTDGLFFARPTNKYEKQFYGDDVETIYRFYERPYQSRSVEDSKPTVIKGFGSCN